ncbi:MAG: hypothetical protein LBF85_06360, partial [Tannerella sp.]|nr:hypothetical protein [Tannerella sp.]
YVDTQTALLQNISKIGAKSLEDLGKARGEALNVVFKPVALTPEELKASKIYPKATSLAFETGYGALRTIPREIQAKHGIMPPFGRGGGANFEVQGGSVYIMNGAEIARLTASGNNSVLDIKKMLDAQFPHAESLADIMRYLELLKEVKFVSW